MEYRLGRVSRNQKNEPFERPEFDDLPAITAMHVEVLKASDADEVWLAAGMNVVAGL